MNGRTFFQALLDSKQMNPHALAQKLKSPTLQSTLQRFLDGKTKEARRSTFEPVAKFFHVELDGFYNPETAVREMQRLGLMPRGVDINMGSSSNIEATAIATGIVPVVSWVQAGAWCDIIDNFQPGDAEDWLPCPVRHGPRTYALVVRGLSMYNPGGHPSFQDGDTIFVDPDRGEQHRSLVIARLDDNHEATFKQLLIEGDQQMLQALNPSWPNRIIPINGNCTMCGVVIGKVESFI